MDEKLYNKGLTPLHNSTQRSNGVNKPEPIGTWIPGNYQDKFLNETEVTKRITFMNRINEQLYHIDRNLEILGTQERRLNSLITVVDIPRNIPIEFSDENNIETLEQLVNKLTSVSDCLKTIANGITEDINEIIY